MKLNLKMSNRNRKTRKQRGGEDNEVSFNRDVADFLTSTRCAEFVNLLSRFNMSEKDWGQLKHNLISLSGEKKIEDVPFTGTMKDLAGKVNATEDNISNASDDLETKPNWNDDNVKDPVDVFCEQLGFEEDLTNRDELQDNPDEIDDDDDDDDESKVEEPKVEDSKDDEEEPKVEEPNVEDSKDDEEEPKVEEPKVEDSKDDEEESKVEEPKVDESKEDVEKPAVEEPVDVNKDSEKQDTVTGGKKRESRKQSQKNKRTKGGKTFKRRTNKN